MVVTVIYELLTCPYEHINENGNVEISFNFKKNIIDYLYENQNTIQKDDILSFKLDDKINNYIVEEINYLLDRNNNEITKYVKVKKYHNHKNFPGQYETYSYTEPFCFELENEEIK